MGSVIFLALNAFSFGRITTKGQWVSRGEYAGGLVTQIDWFRVVFLSVYHVFGIWGTWLFFKRWAEHGLLAGFQDTVLPFAVAFYPAEIGILAGAHRLWSHRSYDAHWILENLLAWSFSSSMQGSCFWWAAKHRVHHYHSDTIADPYDVNRGFFFAHMGWMMLNPRKEVHDARSDCDVSDLEENWVVANNRRYFTFHQIFWGIVVPHLFGYWMHGDHFYAFTVYVCTRVIWIYHRTWTINSVSHMWGWRPFDPNSKPTETMIASIISSGEGWHNYHHLFPRDYSASEYGWAKQWNPTTFFIDLMALIGLAKNRKKITPDLIQKVVDRKHRNIPVS